MKKGEVIKWAQNIYTSHNGHCLKHKDGSKFWFNEYSQFHREDGPAAIIIDGNREHWYLNDHEYETLYDMPLSLFIAYCKWEYRKIYGN